MPLFIVHFIRVIIRSLPKPVRAFLRQNGRLRAAYRSLVKNPHWEPRSRLARLFFKGYSDRVLGTIIRSPLYEKNLARCQSHLKQLSRSSDSVVTVLVLCTDTEERALHLTANSLASLEDKNFQVVFVASQNAIDDVEGVLANINDNAKRFEHKVVSDVELAAQSFNGEGFICYAGNQFNPYLIRAIQQSLSSDTDFAYCDLDHMDHYRRQGAPEYYPDWNPDLQITTAYVHNGLWVRDLPQFLAADTFSLSKGAVASYMMMLALSERDTNILHIPFVLLHKGMRRDSIFKYVHPLVFSRLNALATWRFTVPNQVLALEWKRELSPLVSIVIPTKNGKKLVQDCIESLTARTQYPNYEILLVDNNSDEEESLAYFDALAQAGTVRLLPYPKPFNYSAINNFAVSHAKGEYIALVNNDIEFISGDWLDYMMGHAMRKNVGCVGAKLLYDNHTIQHAGVVMGYGGGAGHAHKYLPDTAPGYLNRAMASNNFSAVTAACLVLSKADYDAVNGLNETEFTVAFNDVDLCLKVLGLGRRNVYCAEAVMYHHESVSRGFDDDKEGAKRFASEVDALKTRWNTYISHDPAYNPNLTLSAENFSVIDSPRQV